MNSIIFVLPLIFGFLIDWILGDPYSLPHPIRLIGNTIAVLENFFRKILPDKERVAGTLLWIIVVVLSTGIPFVVLLLCYRVNVWLGMTVESIFCYYLIAPKCLKKESMKVYDAIQKKDIEKARQCVSMIVGRDTAVLDEKGIIKATVETIAENTSDGVTAPLLYMSIGGAVGGFFYKAVNTMDSMLGYKNDRYLNFGRFSAKADDVMNFVPSRITAVLMIVSAYITGLNGKKAFTIWRRDRFNHTSPNSAQTEAVCAGALGIMLGGDTYYFGKLYKKKTIGDNVRPIENDDIKKANHLMYCTAVITLFLSVILRIVIISVLGVVCR